MSLVVWQNPDSARGRGGRKLRTLRDTWTFHVKCVLLSCWSLFVGLCPPVKPFPSGNKSHQANHPISEGMVGFMMLGYKASFFVCFNEGFSVSHVYDTPKKACVSLAHARSDQ